MEANVAKGEAELPDIAPNFEFANNVLVEAPPKRACVPTTVAAKGDCAEVLEYPLPEGIYIVYSQFRFT